MLTAEKRDEKGKYIKVRTRNEAIDCMVYAIATLTILDIKVDELLKPILFIGEATIPKKVNEDNNNRPHRDAWLDKY